MNQVLLMQGTSVSLPLQDASAQCIVTSPPYFRLRSSLPPGHPLKRYELGRELRHDCLAWARQEPPCAQCYLCRIRTVFAQCRRVLRSDGVMFVVIADSYANEGKWGGRTGGKHVKALHGEALGRQKRQTGLKPKDLCGIPHRLALALQSDGWHWRSDTIWHTVNAFPESMQDRPTRDHEYVLIFRKSARYFWDATAIREAGTGDGWHGSRFTSAQDRATKPGLGQGRRQEQPGRNRRTVWTLPEEDPTPLVSQIWTMPTEPYRGPHYATYPRALAARCIMAGSPQAGCCPTCRCPWRRAGLNGTTPGFRPGCACALLSPLPSIVFDPFVGTGTTLLEARRLGRQGMGLDLDPHALSLARARLGLKALDRWAGKSTPRPPMVLEDLPVFAAAVET